MRKLGQILLIVGSMGVLLGSTLAAQNLTAGAAAVENAAAQLPTGTPQEITPTQLTPPSSPEDTLTPTPTATSTPTETPTATPTHTETPPATNTPTHTPTNTPTWTPTWQTPIVPPPTVPTRTPRPTEQGNPPANPGCNSSVQGKVFNATGQPVSGATVTIQGEGWSSGTMTDDQGHFGFGGLCAGTAVLQAFLPNGRTSPVVSVNLTGQNSVQLNLAPDLGGTTVPTESGQQTTAPTAGPTVSGVEMPTTGFSGWLLAGGAGLAALLLLSAGARRRLRGGGAAGEQQ